MTRTDWLPSPADRAALNGGGAATPNTLLAAAVRAINSRIFRLDPEAQEQLQADWHSSWAELSRLLGAAENDTAAADLITAWRDHWERRLADPEGS